MLCTEDLFLDLFKLLYPRAALQVAAEEGYLAVVKRLLEEKADVNAVASDDGRRTALQTGKVEFDSKDRDGQAPLSLAAGNGHEAVMKLLLEQGAELEAKDSSGQTPLSLAVARGHEAVVKLLLEKGTKKSQ